MPNNKLLGLIHASTHGNGKAKSYLLRELTAASLLCDVMSVLLVLVWPVSAQSNRNIYDKIKQTALFIR